MKRCLLAVLLIALLPWQAVPARAQSVPPPLAIWKPVGFQGTRVDALAAAENGRVLYIATELGLREKSDTIRSVNRLSKAVSATVPRPSAR